MNFTDGDICVMCGKYVPERRQVCQTCEEKEPNFSTTNIGVLLDKITDISEFVHLASKCTDDVMIRQGRWVVSGKSLIGIMCLDLSVPITVEFYGNVPYEVQQGMKKFMR